MSTKLYRNKTLNKSTKVDSIGNSGISTKLTPNKSMEFNSLRHLICQLNLTVLKTSHKCTKFDSTDTSNKSTKFNSPRHLTSL